MHIQGYAQSDWGEVNLYRLHESSAIVSTSLPF